MVAARQKKTVSTRPQRSARNRPAVLLVGDRTLTNAVGRSLDAVQATPWWSPWDEDVSALIDDDTIAVVVVGPLGDVAVADAVATLQRSQAGADTALFAVLTHPLSNAETRRIYAAGATAVFDWPAERRVLPRLLVELLAVDLVRGPMRGADAALARTLRAHLKLSRPFGPALRVRVQDGVAVLAGQVDHLWQKLHVEERVVAVPGIRAVVVRDIHVAPSDRTDKAIRRNVRRFLRDASDVVDATLAITVRRGYVTLAGSVADRRELNRVVGLVSHVRGVRGVERLTVVSPSQKQQDHRAVRRLRRSVAHLMDDGSVTVSFFGGVAVLSGTVARLSTKRALSRIVNDDNVVQRVVNKIDIA